MDTNLDDFIDRQIGVDRLTSSLSLTHEDANNCTKVVHGFHEFVSRWWDRVREREQERDRTGKTRNRGSATTDGSRKYTPEDVIEFGKPIPVPYP